MNRNIALIIDPYTRPGLTFDLVEDHFFKVLRQLKKEADLNKECIVLFLMSTLETVLLTELYPEVVIPMKEVAVATGIHQVYFVTDSSSGDLLRKQDILGKYVNYKDIPRIEVAYYMLWSYNRIFVKRQPYNQILNTKTDKCLFLTGKAIGAHRIGLLSKFYQRKMMNRLEWSLFVNDQIIESSRAFVGDMSDTEYSTFISSCTRNPDSISIEMQPGSSHYCGYPYDVNLYTSTSLSIISETSEEMLSSAMFSEKTWKTIVNKHPFILAAKAGSLTRLGSLGFRTFQEYMCTPEYDTIVDIEDRMQAVVDNAEFFLDNYLLNEENIIRDVEYNFKLYAELVRAELYRVDQITGPGITEKLLFASPDIYKLY